MKKARWVCLAVYSALAAALFPFTPELAILSLITGIFLMIIAWRD